MKRLPRYAFVEDILYLRPKEKCPDDQESPRYEDRPVTLSNMMKEMSMESGIAKKTNHSLRATGASAMFQAGVPERIIQKATGHKSVEGLCTYKQAPTKQFKYVSKVLMGEASESRKENALTTLQPTNVSRILGDITNSTIGNLTINVITIQRSPQEIEAEFDAIVSRVV